ncbi:MAG: SHOCT domain-containing protein [Hyphomicrobium sp.]|nr:MAG: SHOCT domain-containing protein [Hyphomicrobium sp.]
MTLVAPALAQTPGPGGPGYEWMWWWGPWHMLMPLVFFGLIVFGIVALVRYLWPGPAPAERRRALDVLDERYARGEIDREEYLKRRDDLGSR